jgi:nucleoid DNA-binding protein
MAVEWGLVRFEKDPETGETLEVPEERPPKYAIGE